MKQQFAHYEKWEDWQNGMYRTIDIHDKHLKLIGAINLLTSPSEFRKSCIELLGKWIVSASVNMTNNQQNRRAWLGAAACCFTHGTPEFLTRIAWSTLNKSDQDIANAVADEIITLYESKSINHEQAKIGFECA